MNTDFQRVKDIFLAALRERDDFEKLLAEREASPTRTEPRKS
jgi:hypothetical protein